MEKIDAIPVFQHLFKVIEDPGSGMALVWLTLLMDLLLSKGVINKVDMDLMTERMEAVAEMGLKTMLEQLEEEK